MSKRANKKVCIVIPTFKSWEITAKTVNKLLYEQTYSHFDIIIVDAGSEDYEKLENLYKDEDRVIIIHSSKDLGSAGSFWLGMKYAYQEGYEVFILSDNDAIPISNNLIEKLVNEIENNCEFVLAPYEEGLLLGSNYENRVKVKARPFHFLTLSRKVIERVGFPSIEFFIWHDDGEYCERIRKKFDIYILTSIKYAHEFPPSTLHYFYSKRYHYNIRNQILMYLKRWNKANPKNFFVGLLRLIFRIFILQICIFVYAFFIKEKFKYIIRSLNSIFFAFMKNFGKIEDTSRIAKLYNLIGDEINEKEISKIQYDLILIPNFKINLENIKIPFNLKKDSISSKLYSNISDFKYALYLLKFYLIDPIFKVRKNILALEFEAPNFVTAKTIVVYDIFQKKFLKIENNFFYSFLYYLCSLLLSLMLTLLFTIILLFYEIKYPYKAALKSWFDKELLNLTYEVIRCKNLKKEIITTKDLNYLLSSVE